jgi:UDP-glucuronate decarboxylase
MDYWREHGLEVRILRIFNTYGPRMALDDGRVVSNFVAQALTGQPITVYGDGEQGVRGLGGGGEGRVEGEAGGGG